MHSCVYVCVRARARACVCVGVGGWLGACLCVGVGGRVGGWVRVCVWVRVLVNGNLQVSTLVLWKVRFATWWFEERNVYEVVVTFWPSVLSLIIIICQPDIRGHIIIWPSADSREKYPSRIFVSGKCGIDKEWILARVLDPTGQCHHRDGVLRTQRIIFTLLRKQRF